MGAKIKWGDANLLLPNFCVLPAVSSQLSVFSKLCVMNTLLHFLQLLRLCRSLRNISLGGRILGKSNVIITVGRVWWRHQRAPLLSLASGPPTLNPPLPIMSTNFAWKHEYGVKLWRQKQRTLNTNDHLMPLKETTPMKIFCVRHWMCCTFLFHNWKVDRGSVVDRAGLRVM